MAPTPLTERTRDRLLALLADDRPDDSTLLERLGELGRQGNVAVFSATVALLAQLDLPDLEAQRVVAGLLRHRSDMFRALRRDPGLRVAALDFLSNLERRLTNPGMVEDELGAHGGLCGTTDPLTGLLARRFFGAAVASEVRRAHRFGHPCSLILLDPDRFRPINDAYGHLFGDVLLEHAAGVVRRSIRDTDLGCLLEGARFAVLLPQTPRSGAATVAERIRARAEAELGSGSIHGHPIRLTLSGGVVCHPEDAQTPDTLFARAQAALRLAKSGGRNRIVGHHAERRRSQRHAAGRALRAQAGHAPGGPLHAVQALNLSRSGILLATQDTFHAADPIRVILRADDSGAGQAPVLPGRVVRVERDRGDATRITIGVAFDLPLPEAIVRGGWGAA